MIGDYRNPILKPQAAEAVKKHDESEFTGVRRRPRATSAGPKPYRSFLGNMGMQMIQQPDKIVILYDHDHQIRHVRMNEPHPTRVTPS